jgi:RimJ/RimL family protein N-acetyltransferase
VIYHYAFLQVGARRLSATTRCSNKRMQRMLPRLGFECEGVGKRFFGPRHEDDAMRFVLLPERAGSWAEAPSFFRIIEKTKPTRPSAGE